LSDLLSISTLVGRNGEESEIKNGNTLLLPPKLTKFLAIPFNPFPFSLSFHPSGYLYFSVPKPPPRPLTKCRLLLLAYEPQKGVKIYYYVLAEPGKEEAYLAALKGSETFDLRSYFYIIASGHGDPPDGLREKLLAKYDAVISESPSAPPHPLIP